MRDQIAASLVSDRALEEALVALAVSDNDNLNKLGKLTPDDLTDPHIAAPKNVPDRDAVASSKMLPLPHQSGAVLPAAVAAAKDGRSRAAIFLGRDLSLLNDSTTRLRAIARRQAFNRRCSVRS
jgi:hypothetical protein